MVRVNLSRAVAPSLRWLGVRVRVSSVRGLSKG